MTSDLSSFASRLPEFISGRSAESMLSAEADAGFNRLALTLFALQFERNSPYRKFCEARGASPNSIGHWSQIPAVPAAAFKELDLTCLPPEERTAVFHSSGTTEQRPSRHFHSAESLEVYEASLWPWFQNNVLPGQLPQSPTSDRQSALRNPHSAIFLTPPPAEAPRSSLVHMFEVVRRKLDAPASVFLGEIGADGTWSVHFDRTLAALRGAVGASRPSLLLGTAFSFVHLLDQLTEHNLRFDLPAGSTVMETGGYKGRSRALPKAELHSLITARLGVPPSHIICEYGMSELSSQAYDRPDQKSKIENQKSPRLFQLPHWARVEIVSPEDGRSVAEGETGLLRIFDLANVFSVMAIQTEDLAVKRAGGFELIGRAESSEPRGCSLMSQSTARTPHSAIA